MSLPNLANLKVSSTAVLFSPANDEYPKDGFSPYFVELNPRVREEQKDIDKLPAPLQSLFDPTVIFPVQGYRSMFSKTESHFRNAELAMDAFATILFDRVVESSYLWSIDGKTGFDSLVDMIVEFDEEYVFKKRRRRTIELTNEERRTEIARSLPVALQEMIKWRLVESTKLRNGEPFEPGARRMEAWTVDARYEQYIGSMVPGAQMTYEQIMTLARFMDHVLEGEKAAHLIGNALVHMLEYAMIFDVTDDTPFGFGAGTEWLLGNQILTVKKMDGLENSIGTKVDLAFSRPVNDGLVRCAVCAKGTLPNQWAHLAHVCQECPGYTAGDKRAMEEEYGQ